MKKIFIIDSDLLDNGTNYPNLALMKISSYNKKKGYETILLLDYNQLLYEEWDEAFLSKVFTKTKIPKWVLEFTDITIGGTGFDFDKQNKLDYEIEHSKPDYELYREYVEQQKKKGIKLKKLEYYTDYSIGFMTRGCIRGCSFCVNKNSKRVEKHSPLQEFLHDNHKKITLWDDNILAYANWREVFDELISTGKRFKFQQGLDFRLLTREKMEYLKKVKYDGEFTFAFDNIKDKELIIRNMKIWNDVIGKQCRFYVFCGFENIDTLEDLNDVFERIKILAEHGHIPYIMRHENYIKSPYKDLYIQIAKWCNQPSFFKKQSLWEFSQSTQKAIKSNKECCMIKVLKKFEELHKEKADEWFNLKYENLKK